MAKCGIKEYDELPGRVKLWDVDYLRFRLRVCMNPPTTRLGKLLKPKHDDNIKESCIVLLERAYHYHKDGPSYGGIKIGRRTTTETETVAN